MPRCSIVIPAYNVERYVGEAVGSALAQTYADREIVVVDDGSTDGTAEVLRGFGDRIVYLEQPNRGPSAARNAGIAASSGALIALLDADDVWLPGRLERMIRCIEEHPELGLVTQGIGRHLPAPDEDQGYWIVQKNFVAANAVIRKELFERHGGFDEAIRASVDWELWIRFLTRGERCGFVSMTGLSFKRFHPGAITYDWRRHCRSELVMLERVRSKGRLRALDGRIEIARGRVAAIEGDVAAAGRHFRRAAFDRELAPSVRLEAAPFAISPRFAWRAYERFFDLRRRRRERSRLAMARSAGFDV